MAAPSPAYFYEAGPVPPGPPVPPMAGVGPTVPTGPAPPYMQHMCTTMPPPQIAVSSAGTPAGGPPGGPGGKNATGLVGGGRGTPSPHAPPPPPPNHTSTATTVSTSSSIVSSSEIQPQNYEVEYHLHQGEVISFTLSDGRVEIIPGKKI